MEVKSSWGTAVLRFSSGPYTNILVGQGEGITDEVFWQSCFLNRTTVLFWKRTQSGNINCNAAWLLVRVAPRRKTLFEILKRIIMIVMLKKIKKIFM